MSYLSVLTLATLAHQHDWQNCCKNYRLMCYGACKFSKGQEVRLVIAYPHSNDEYRVSQEERARLWENVPYVKVHRYNPKHLYPKLNGYGDNGQRKVWSSCGSTYCTSCVRHVTRALRMSVLESGMQSRCKLRLHYEQLVTCKEL